MNDAEYIAAIAEFYKDGPSPEFRAHYERLTHISAAIAAAPAQPEEANDDDVICPKCVHQFRAIPVNVQRLMLDAGFVPPFTAAPAQAGEYPAGTGNPEADRIICRLASSDPDFDDCADAVALIHKLISESKGPDGFATWKDAAIANRAARGAAQDAPVDAAAQQDAERRERERICAAIKAEDDYCVEHGDYMLDSDDCIKIVRGEWKRPEFAAHGIAAQQGDAA